MQQVSTSPWRRSSGVHAALFTLGALQTRMNIHHAARRNDPQSRPPFVSHGSEALMLRPKASGEAPSAHADPPGG